MSKGNFKSLLGDYEKDPSNRIKEAQQLFFREVGKAASQVITDLDTACYEAFSKIERCKQRNGSWSNLDNDPENDSEKLLREKIYGWSRRWNLDADWCRDLAFTALASWKNPDLREQRKITSPLIITDNIPSPGEDFLGETLPYFPANDSRNALAQDDSSKSEDDRYKSYLERVREEANRRIQADPLLKYGEPSHRKSFIDSICRNVETAYCIPEEESFKRRYPSATTTPANPASEKHITWAVRVRFCETPNDVTETFKQIAIEEDCTETAIRKAVTKLLRLIKLPLQPTIHPYKGRRKGQKNSPKAPHRPGKTN